VMAACSVTPSGLSALRQGSLRALLQMGHLQVGWLSAAAFVSLRMTGQCAMEYPIRYGINNL
jgi:hypothetical protein